jgi:hypothetical protein
MRRTTQPGRSRFTHAMGSLKPINCPPGPGLGDAAPLGTPKLMGKIIFYRQHTALG